MLLENWFLAADLFTWNPQGRNATRNWFFADDLFTWNPKAGMLLEKLVLCR